MRVVPSTTTRVRPALEEAPDGAPARACAAEHVVDVERAPVRALAAEPAAEPEPEPDLELELETASPVLTWRMTFRDREDEAAYAEGELRDAFYRRTISCFAFILTLNLVVLGLQLLPGRRVSHYVPAARVGAIMGIAALGLVFCAATRRRRTPVSVAQATVLALLCAQVVLIVVLTPGRSLRLLGLVPAAYGVVERSFDALANVSLAIVMTAGFLLPMDVHWFLLLVAWTVSVLVVAEAQMPSERCGAAMDMRDGLVWLLVLGITLGGVVSRARAQRRQWYFRRSVLAAARRWRRAERAEMDAHAREASAQSATDARAKLIRIVMHDLRSPLLSVHGLAKGLSEAEGERTLSEPGVRASLDALQTCSTLMEGIVSDMLDFERIDSGRLNLVLQPFSLGKLLGDARVTLGALAERKGVSLALEPLPPELEERLFLGDRRRLLQCLSNGVSNAVKFVEPPHGRVTLRAWEERGALAPAPPPPGAAVSPANPAEDGGAGAWTTVHIAVQDNGIGLDEAELRALSSGKPFQQVGRGQLQGSGGTGLGLAIVRSILRLHGESELRLRSEGHRQGTTFEMRLRLRRAEAARPPTLDGGPSGSCSASYTTACSSPSPLAPHRVLPRAFARISRAHEQGGGRVRAAFSPTASPSARRPDPSPPASRAAASEDATADPAPAAPPRAPRCLHVEDDGMLRLMVGEQLFRKCGVRWESAPDGQAALEAVGAAEAAGDPITFVVLDNQMPIMGGTECAAALRARGFAGPIVGVTGDPTGSPDRAEFEAVGLDACHDKTSDGLAAIEALLRAHVESLEPGAQATTLAQPSPAAAREGRTSQASSSSCSRQSGTMRPRSARPSF